MKRRLLLGLGAAMVLHAGRTSAQVAGRTVRIGILTGLAETDPETVARLSAFRQAITALGWRDGQNLSLDVRYEPNSTQRAEQLVAELLALTPDVMVVQGPAVAIAKRVTTTVPIVFVVVPDPVGQKMVDSLAQPGGNLTGFTSTEPSFGSKWIELLKEIAPKLKRIAVLTHNNAGFYRPSIDAAARNFGLDIAYSQVDTAEDIDAAIAALIGSPDGGLVLPTDAFTAVHRRRIIELAARHNLPLITGNPPFPQDGGLMYYGADVVDMYARAAAYVDRILRGAKPAELPVQQPTRFKMVINLKTAAALGLTVPGGLRIGADEVIE